MIEIPASEIGTWLGSFLWPLFRIAGLLMVAPIFSAQLVPARIRLMLSILIAMALMPLLPAPPAVELISFDSFVITIQQVLIGISMGFVLQVLLQLFVVAGQLIAMQMGLGFASMVDPANGVSVTVLSQFHLMLVTLLFLAMNGHLATIEILAESFYILPIGSGFLSNEGLWGVVRWSSWMFTSALLIALPAIAALLIINFSMGVITRAAPQLNIFAIGFPFMLIIGLCIIYITLNGYVPQFDRYTREALDMMRGVVLPA